MESPSFFQRAKKAVMAFVAPYVAAAGAYALDVAEGVGPLVGAAALSAVQAVVVYATRNLEVDVSVKGVGPRNW